MRTRLQVADLNAIESRVGAWLAECPDLMNVFEPYTDIFGEYQPNGRDPYLAFSVKMYGGQYDAIYADYKGKNGKQRKGDAKRKRQVAKPGVLGAIYRLSGGELIYVFTCPDCKHTWTSKVSVSSCERCAREDVKADYSKKTGLWDYADKMGVEMSQEQAHDVVRIFRDSYPEICDPKTGVWKRLEEAVMDVMHPDHPATVRYIGPNNCVKIDRLNYTMGGKDGCIMRMTLPSGRVLHYMDAKLKSTKMPWQGEDEDGNPVDIFRDTLVYSGMNQKTKQWSHGITTHGGKLFENLVQAIARDILGAKLLKFEERGMLVVAHVHDEGVALVVDDIFSPTVHDMVGIMSEPEPWAPRLRLGADGFESAYYRK